MHVRSFDLRILANTFAQGTEYARCERMQTCRNVFTYTRRRAEIDSISLLPNAKHVMGIKMNQHFIQILFRLRSHHTQLNRLNLPKLQI